VRSWVHGNDAAVVAFIRPGAPQQYPRIDCSCYPGSGKGNLRSRPDPPLKRSMAGAAETVVIGASDSSGEQVPLAQQARR
jgi:hypothetical protein